MTTWLPAAYLTLSLIILIWDVVLAGRIAQLRQASQTFAAITGIVGLLLLPAVLLRIATSTFITGRSVVAVDWIWPLILVLVMIQAIYAISRRLVNPLWGVPIVVYDVLVAGVEVVRYGIAHGSPLATQCDVARVTARLVTRGSQRGLCTEGPVAGHGHREHVGAECRNIR